MIFVLLKAVTGRSLSLPLCVCVCVCVCVSVINHSTNTPIVHVSVFTGVIILHMWGEIRV